jgi:HTH-type transcriptional regulator, cell division transcriptional repressor
MPHAMKKTQHSAAKNEAGPAIRKVRMDMKNPLVSQEDLSGRLAKIGIQLDRSALSRIENQDRCLMDYELTAIARALGVKASKLLGE